MVTFLISCLQEQQYRSIIIKKHNRVSRKVQTFFFSISGSFEWDIQELLAPSSSEQPQSKEIASLLFMSKNGQDCATTPWTCFQKRRFCEWNLPRLYLVYVVGVHTEALQSWYEDPWGFLQLAPSTAMYIDQRGVKSFHNLDANMDRWRWRKRKRCSNDMNLFCTFFIPFPSRERNLSFDSQLFGNPL